MQACRSLDIHILSVGTQNRLQTTQLSVEVSYLAEQLLYCDLLRLNLLTGRFVRFDGHSPNVFFNFFGLVKFHNTGESTLTLILRVFVFDSPFFVGNFYNYFLLCSSGEFLSSTVFHTWHYFNIDYEIQWTSYAYYMQIML